MASNADEQSKGNGRWTKEEHQKFILGIQIYGKEWKRIEALIESRNGAQIRSHAQKYYLKAKKDSEPAEHFENWEQTKETPPEYQKNLCSLVLPPEPENRPEYSYYLNRIVQNDALKQGFNFWESLVDHKPLPGIDLPEGVLKRPSFVSTNSEPEQAEGSQPSKKIKCE